jgi:DNA polymerase-1
LIKPNKLFLLDAMALIYRAHFAFIKNPIINSKGINTSAIYGFLNTLLEVIKKENPSHIGVAFDTKAPTFRSKMFKEYKANRQKQPEDIQIAIPYIKKIIKSFNIPILEKDGFEADDIIGTFANIFSKEKETQIFMMTPDKDFAQLVSSNVFLYKPAFMGRGVDILGEKEVLNKFKINRVDQVIDFLGLQGDSVDNIPGIPGVGPKTAQVLLAKYDSVEGIIKNKEEIKGILGDKIEQYSGSAILSKSLAKIKTDIPVSTTFEDLILSKPNKEKLLALLEDLEFRTIKKRIYDMGLIIEQEEEKKQQESQLRFFSTSLETIESEKVSYSVVSSREIYVFVEELKKQKQICFDTETTSLNIQEAELVGISISYKQKQAFYIPTLNKKERKNVTSLLKPILENKSVVLIGHNLKYDVQIMKKYNINISQNVFDTMLAHYLISPETSHKLDSISESFLNHKTIPIEDIIGKKGVDQKNMKDIPVKDVYKYACEDADITFRLKSMLEKEIVKLKLEELLIKIEQPLLFVLADMEGNGVNIDVDFLTIMSKELFQKINKTEMKIYKKTGKTFNISSPKQLGNVLFEKLKIEDNPKKTKSGQYSTSEDVLQKLSKKNEIVDLVLRYREYKKLKSTYVDALPKMVSNKDNLIHTDYAQAVTVTGRLSSNKPNLQNIPIKTKLGRKIRSAFIPRNNNNIILAADYSQVELRIMADFSQDKEMIKAFKEGQDIHQLTASKVFNVSLSSVDGTMRRKAKEVNFGIIYGISPFGLSQNLQISRAEAKEIIDAYFNKFSDVKNYIDNAIIKARKKKYVETLLGRRRYLRDIDSRNFTLRSFSERNAINSPIQGSAADIIKLAMIEISKWIKKNEFNSKMIMQVHDELVFDVCENELEYFQSNIKKIMENVVKLRVPLTVDLGVGKTWLEAH